MTADDIPDAEFNIDEIEAELAEPAAAEGYVSPVMERVTAQRLTVEFLSELIPLIRDGDAAAEQLAAGTITDPAALRELRRAARDGGRAKERVFYAALPLIRTVAMREFRRRQQWQSRVSLDDLTQDAIIGFFKGLSRFKVEAIRKSATNYLGQWMLVEMRRSAEQMDHDLSVGHDAGERFRRVRALRSRLIQDLGREPTDEEIAEASRDPNYVTRPGMVGRAPADGDKAAAGKGLTVAQVAEERAMRDRVGTAERIGSSADTDEDSRTPLGVLDVERMTQAETGHLNELSDPSLLIDEVTGEQVIVLLVGQVIERMRLPEQQSEIISRRYGLAPFQEESSAREIARVMGIHRERVSRVLAAFAEEMTKRGGVFHQLVARISDDELQDLGLGWVTSTLGAWDPAFDATVSVPRVLTEPISLNTGSKAVPGATTSTTAGGILAFYLCDYHDRLFSSLYPTKESAPKQRKCPECQRLSDLVRIQAS